MQRNLGVVACMFNACYPIKTIQKVLRHIKKADDFSKNRLLFVVENRGFEPLTPRLRTWCSTN